MGKEKERGGKGRKGEGREGLEKKRGGEGKEGKGRVREGRNIVNTKLPVSQSVS